MSSNIKVCISCATVAVVFKVLTVVCGKLNIDILFSGFVNFDLFLVKTEAVVTSEPPTLAVNSNSVCDTIYLTKPVTVTPASLTNEIESPIFKSTVKFVPLPKRVASELAI